MSKDTSETSDIPVEAKPLDEKEQACFDTVLAKLEADGHKAVKEMMLIQFVRGYSYEEDWPGKVYEAITATLKWREEREVDTICERRLEKRELFKETWTTIVSGSDKHGHLIACDRLGAIKPSTVTSDFTIEELEAHHIQNQEFVAKMKEEASKKAGMRIYKMISILDLDGIGMGHSGGKFTNPAKALMDIDQKHYPESMLKMYLVNVPWVFKMIWKVVRPWLHPVTQEKIHVCGSDFLKELQADGLTLDQLPECIGGTGSDKLAEFEQAYFAKAEAGELETSESASSKKKKTKKKKKKKADKEGADDDDDDEDEDEKDE